MSNVQLSPEQKQKLRDAVQEAVNSLYRQKAETDLRKEIAKRMEEELEIDKKRFTKLTRIAYKDSAKAENEEITAILDLAEELGIYAHSE